MCKYLCTLASKYLRGFPKLLVLLQFVLLHHNLLHNIWYLSYILFFLGVYPSPTSYGSSKKTGHPEVPKFQGQIPISEQTISIAISDCWIPLWLVKSPIYGFCWSFPTCIKPSVLGVIQHVTHSHMRMVLSTISWNQTPATIALYPLAIAMPLYGFVQIGWFIDFQLIASRLSQPWFCWGVFPWLSDKPIWNIMESYGYGSKLRSPRRDVNYWPKMLGLNLDQNFWSEPGTRILGCLQCWPMGIWSTTGEPTGTHQTNRMVIILSNSYQSI